ncbi:MAG TPA: hypothetical protein DEA96_12105 [Leptospiraceae bacterium]|nr:hypothetical protein [Spirochaetaceae bacterium]HBS05703.1 hypothetical protein [Leptospiraceae bacterium]
MQPGIKSFLYFSEKSTGWIRPLIGLAAVLGLLHVLKLDFALDGELHPDEAYYWAWSQFPALSYYDQGPGIAYYIWLWTSVLGDHYITLKLAALFASFVTIFFFCLAGLEWGFRGWQPLLAGLTLFFIPGILGGNHLIMHDSMMILAWSGALWMSVRAIRTRSAASLLGLFLFLGIGGLSKYTMFLFAVALVLWLLLHPNYREFWIRPASWLGLLLAGSIISPIIIWNSQNHWDGIGAIIHLRSSGGVDSGGSTGAYLAGQFTMFSPLWMAAFVGLASIFSYRSMRSLIVRFKNRKAGSDSRNSQDTDPLEKSTSPDQAASHLLWIVTAVPFLFFAILSGNREIQANWVFPAYGSAVLLLIYHLLPVGEQSAAVSNSQKNTARRFPVLKWTFLAGWLPVLALDFFFLFSIPLAVYLPVETYWVPGYRTLGFKNVITGVERIQKEHPEAELVANRYQDASIGWFYNREQKYVPSINIMQRNQFSYWPGLEPGKDYIFYHIQENTCEKSVSFLGVILPSFFEEVVEYPEEEVIHNRRVIKRYQVWYARNLQSPWDQGMFEFLRDEAIYQNMVGLKVPQPGEVVKVNEAFQKFSELWMRIYMTRKGKQDCSVF